MLGFQKIYPQAKIVNLEVNYRCEPPIVEAAMRLIAHNEERFPKKIRAGKAGKQKVRFQYFAIKRMHFWQKISGRLCKMGFRFRKSQYCFGQTCSRVP